MLIYWASGQSRSHPRKNMLNTMPLFLAVRCQRPFLSHQKRALWIPYRLRNSLLPLHNRPGKGRDKSLPPPPPPPPPQCHSSSISAFTPKFGKAHKHTNTTFVRFAHTHTKKDISCEFVGRTKAFRVTMGRGNRGGFGSPPSFCSPKRNNTV